MSLRSVLRPLGPILLGAGGVLLGESVATGGARLYLLLIVPVFTGTTALFAVSVALLVAGFLLLPLLFVGEEFSDTATEPVDISPVVGGPPEEAGGLILVGPIPIFFGAWRRTPPIAYRWAVVLGVVLAAAAFLLLWGLGVL